MKTKKKYMPHHSNQPMTDPVFRTSQLIEYSKQKINDLMSKHLTLVSFGVESSARSIVFLGQKTVPKT